MTLADLLNLLSLHAGRDEGEHAYDLNGDGMITTDLILLLGQMG